MAMGAQGRHAIHIHTFGDFSEGFTGAGQSWQMSTSVRAPGLLVVGVVVAQLQRSPNLPCCGLQEASSTLLARLTAPRTMMRGCRGTWVSERCL